MNDLLSITRQDPMQILHQEELRKFSFHLPFLPSGSLTSPSTLLVDPHPNPQDPQGQCRCPGRTTAPSWAGPHEAPVTALSPQSGNFAFTAHQSPALTNF